MKKKKKKENSAVLVKIKYFINWNFSI